MVVEMAEELLVAGFPEKMAIQLLNTALVMGREEVYFSTVDMCVFNLYEGSCKFLKAGASTTFIRHGGQVEKITSTTLPVGVMQNIEIDCVTRKLSDGDFVVMVTDGVMGCAASGRTGSTDRWISVRTEQSESERNGASCAGTSAGEYRGIANG